MTEATPEVSVIVISYNDAGRLPRAIASVQKQTLRNLEIIVVDDASTDDTASIVADLAAADPRIRYACLPENSGGCSAPRNHGLELARAPWVMFCDSDDEYERHACKNLLLAAERLNADVVVGTAERVDVATGEVKRWKPELHEAEVVVDTLDDFPDLLADTISVNKIYRRSLLMGQGLRFPVGLLFEDQLFTLEAMASAGRVASIPETVYRWYVDQVSDAMSITQRRHEAANVESRIEINRRIDTFLAETGRESVQHVKNYKFLKHDLYLYLSSMLEVDDETAQLLIDRLRPYVESVPLEPAWSLRPGLRQAIFHLLVDDLDGVRAAMRFVKWASVLDVPILSVGGRDLWGCEHALSDIVVGGFSAQDWLDVTPLHIPLVPYSQRRFLHELTGVDAENNAVDITGRSYDYDGSLVEAERVELQLLIGSARVAASLPVEWESTEGARLYWRARGTLTARLSRELRVADRGTVAIVATRNQIDNISSVRCRQADLPATTITFPDTRRKGVETVAVVPAPNGAVGWSAVVGSEATHGGASPWTRLKKRMLVPMAIRWGRFLPARATVVFESSQSSPINPEARALSGYLAGGSDGIREVWVHQRRPELVPAGVMGAERWSFAHKWAMARAKWVIDDGTAAFDVKPRSDARVVFLGDGVPVRRLGLDDPQSRSQKGKDNELREQSGRWDVALVASRYAQDILGSSRGFRGDVVETGLLSADPIIANRLDRDRLMASLDLAHDRPIILYAPESRGANGVPASNLLNLGEWATALGERVYLLVVGHGDMPFDVATTLRFAVRNITHSRDVESYLAAADLLISDYSSRIGQAAVAGIPVIAYQPDRDRFIRRTHGLYVDPAGTFTAAYTTAQLIATVESWLDDRRGWESGHEAALSEFASTFCGATDGHSCQRASQYLAAGKRS